jgi:excisionase family DNA binding protein
VIEKLLDSDELAELLGVPSKTLADWRLRGLGPAFVRVGRHVRYEPAAVDEWKAKQTVRPREVA